MNRACHEGKIARINLKPETANPYNKVFGKDKESRKSHENYYWWLAGYNDEGRKLM